MASIPRFPQSYISQNAIDFLFDLLDNHKINSNHWNRLNPKEKRLIEGAIKFADLDDVLGIKPQIDEEYRRQLKEFQIIRGQIIAGNNAEQLLQQLEAYIKNFMENGHLSNKEGTEILQEIRQIV
jgi:TRAP-type mannitol/chloroaromatic compound transport system substrate-binding protein